MLLSIYWSSFKKKNCFRLIYARVTGKFSLVSEE